MNALRIKWWAGASAVAATMTFAPAAIAAPCMDQPNATIGLGTSNGRPLAAAFAAELAALPDPITLVYVGATACQGLGAVLDDTPYTGTASYWEIDGTEVMCEIDVPGTVPDFALIQADPTLCEGVDMLPDGIGEFVGPVTALSMIVPAASSQVNISAEAMYFVYGFGPSEGMVSPWTIDAEVRAREPSASSQITFAIAAGIPLGKFKGEETATAGEVVAALTSSANPEAALGFVAAELADANRDIVKTLAFQAYDQECAYWPDSTATAFDKQNVRDGHYFVWSPTRIYAPVDGSGEIIHEPTRIAVGYMTDTIDIPDDFPALDLTIDTGPVPRCAMEVWRDEEAGPLYSLMPDEPCGCYYEFRSSGSTSCTACELEEDCPTDAPVCRYGYCEVQ
ncbi:MAG TPA: hypothetical protein VG755_16045 [Nannocystaceae bacterium]|nr:hypothetical protein [Nannocystaceae bacterium]